MPDKINNPGSGDAPNKKDKDKNKEEPQGKKKEPEPPLPEEEPEKTAEDIAREEADFRAFQRKMRFKRKWPEITKVKLTTRPWHPPSPPRRKRPASIELPEIKTRKWVPPYRRRRRARPKLMRFTAEEMTQPLYECAKLKKIWHGFSQVEKNKMMCQGNIGCNSKRYSSTACGSQTACIAVVAKGLLEEKQPSQLIRTDVDDVIENGDRYYRQCMLCMKCYKGKPQLQMNQLMPFFYLHDTKYTIKLNEVERGQLAKHPDNLQSGSDFMQMMEKRIGSTYSMILSVGDKNFLIWGHPPSPESGSQVRTVCYILDPHMLNDVGQPDKLYGAGAFIRYAGITSFVLDFLANYGNLESAKKGNPIPDVVLTDIEIVQTEPLMREPTYELDLKALKMHCQSEWDSYNYNILLEKKRNKGKYPLCSLSAVSLATSRSSKRGKVKDFYQKSTPKEPPPTLPVQPEKAPQNMTLDQIMQLRGENFFLYCPRQDQHTYGRDDMLPLPKSETILHSAVDVAELNYHSQFQQVDVEKWILRATRHMASMRYSQFKTFTSIACCVAAMALLRRLRARAWNEDMLDETLDAGFNIYRESLVERGGPIRRLVLGELNETFSIRDKEYSHKERGIAVWGKILSNSATVLDLCRGIDQFFKESDCGILQIPGEYETAIWHEGGMYYVYHPWPADKYGYKVSLQGGGKACLIRFTRASRLCEHFIQNVADMKRKPFSIADVQVTEKPAMPEPVNQFKTVAPNRWVIHGSFHEEDARFPEDHRGKQATPTSIAAIAMAHIVDPSTWTREEVDETLIRGDILYQNTMEHLEKMGISLETPRGVEEETGEEDLSGGSGGTLAAVDVMNRFRISDYDCIESDVLDSQYNGSLQGDPESGIASLKESLKHLFKEHSYGVITARGNSTAVWKHEDCYYFFDPHGCDDNGYPSTEPRAAACLVRIKGSVNDLAAVVESNLPPGADDSFNISPVAINASRLNAELEAPETKLESKAFQWIKKGTAAVMPGPRGENTALGKAAEKAGVPKEDLAGRTIALPAAAAFTAAAEAVPPPHMHQDHMYNFLDAGADYYLNHIKKTGRKEIAPEDLTEKFEMGANTFSIELGEPVRLPLWLPYAMAGEGEEEAEEKEYGEEEEEEKEKPPTQIKEALQKMWLDETKPTTVSLLVGDYHQLGVWQRAGGQVVAFDPAPTIGRGVLTTHRITKGDELRMQRIKDEMSGEGGDEAEEAEDEAGGEGEEVPELPQVVPPESAPALMVFASPVEFLDKLVAQGGLNPKQCLSPYKLYPVRVTNDLTSLLKENLPKQTKGEGDEGGDEEPSESLIEPLDDEAIGKYFTRLSRSKAVVRGRVAQHEPYFMDKPNRDNQDAANSVMGIVVEHIEPYLHWKPQLIDAILKYGDRLYTASLTNSRAPPSVTPGELQREFRVTNFNVRLEITPDVVCGDLNAGQSGPVLSVTRGLQKFLETEKYGVICAKSYCVGIWKGADDKSYCLWEPHAVGPTGKYSPGGAAALVLFSRLQDLADTVAENMRGLLRPGNNKYSISSIKVFWEFSKTQQPVTPQGAVPDEGYEWKVLTAYVETARGRTVLRGTRPPDIVKFTRDCLLQSSCGAIVAACMAHVRRPPLWTRRTVDEVITVAGDLLSASVANLGYELRPGEDTLLPLQVLKRFILGVNYVRYDLQMMFGGRLEQTKPSDMSVRCALEKFFESHTHGILWSTPHAVAIWRVPGAPPYYMVEPHACGPTGLRIDAQDDGAACVLTFTSAKLMAFAYLQNIPVVERPRHDFQLYAISVKVQPIKKLGGVDPPFIMAPPGVQLVPATSKVDILGRKRRARESDRKHPPGSNTCLDAQRAADIADKEEKKAMKGQRNTSGWLVLSDGTQYLSAQHSMACRKFSYAARGNQALACCVMAVAMSRVEDVCRWCSTTLDEILESGDQLHQDSYLHYRPKGKYLGIEQILRKFYAPGNCVCRVQVYQPRQAGAVDASLGEQVLQFFREEKAGVLVAGDGEFAVALFRTPRGFYMWDPADRDRYGRAVAPPCVGHARACFSQYPNVKTLVAKLAANIPPIVEEPEPSQKDVNEKSEEQKGVRFERPAEFKIYGMEVTGLRRLNRNEK